MAYRDKRSVRNLTPIEAGFVRFFELMETSFKNVNSNYKNIEVQNPNQCKGIHGLLTEILIVHFKEEYNGNAF